MSENQQPQSENEQQEGTPITFGMTPGGFRGAALGIAAAYILSGLAGMIFGQELPTTMLAIVFALIGYIIADKRLKKANQQADAGKDAQPSDQTGSE